MATLWGGGGAGLAGAGGAHPRRRGTESAVGNSLPSTQCLLAENLHFLEAETILEAEELLGTMQDYLDSSVISIIEDFSSLTETKGRTDADNELSLLTAITEILDSTDDESLSPFDTIPDSELLISPKEHDHSSFHRFLSLSRTPPKQDFHSMNDFEEPRICTIMTEKFETCATSLSLAVTPDCPKDQSASKKPNSKGPCVERRISSHIEREPPTLQHSEEEEEEEETMDCAQDLVADVKEIPETSVTKEVETYLPPSKAPSIITPASISLSELVKSMHSYCQPTYTVCLSPKPQPLAEEKVACPVTLERVPDDRQSIEVPEILQKVEVELSCRTDSSSTPGQVNKATDLLVVSLDKASTTNGSKTEGLERDHALGSQAKAADVAVLQRKEDACLEAQEEVWRSMADQENTSQLGPGAPIKLSALETGKRSGNTRKNKRKCSKEKKKHKEVRSSRPQKEASSNLSSDKKQVEKAGRRDQAKHSQDQVSHANEKLEEEEEKSFKNKAELEPPNPPMPNLKSSEALSCTQKHQSTQHQEDAEKVPADQRSVQESNQESKPVSPTDEAFGPDSTISLPSSIVDVAGQSPTRLLSSEEVSCPTKEAKPRPLSLTEYRQRRQQCQTTSRGTSSTTGKQSASKWPSLHELPTELADLRCLLVPPPPPKLPRPRLVGRPEKPDSTSSSSAPADKASATSLSLQTTAAPALAPCFQNGTVNPAPLTAPVPVVSSQPSEAGPFPLVGSQVPPIPPPTYLPPTTGAFLPAPSNSYILGSPPPVPPWAHFVPLPAVFKGLPPPSSATKACPAAFHTVPPVPPPTWPPPPVPLPSFGSGLPYNSIGATGPQLPYWPGIPVPPPVLPIPLRDQGVLIQSPSAGAFLTPSFSEQASGQQNTAPTLESSLFRMQNLTTTEMRSPLAQMPHVEHPSTAKIASRRISDPRRQAQSCVAESKAEVTPDRFQPMGKLLSPPSVVEPSEKPGLPQPVKKSSILQSSGESHSVFPSERVKDCTGTVKFLAEPPFAEPEEKSCTVPAAVQGAKETPPAAQPQDKFASLPAALVPETLTVPTAMELDAVSNSPATTVPKKVLETGLLSKTPTHRRKLQPLLRSGQHSHNKDIVQEFISEIGIEASDLSSLLEQFEKIEAKDEASGVAKSKGSIATGNNGSEAQQEKKMVDQLQAPELTNVAGLTPPATPPYQLWKPLAAVSLLSKAGSPKGARLAKALSRPFRKAPALLHVGSGEHDYCQLSAAPSTGASRWNVKHNMDITIKPIMALTKEPDHPTTNQPLAVTRMDPVGAVSMAAACQNPKEALSPSDACQDPSQHFNHAAPSLSPARSTLSESTLTRLPTEPLDHRTSTPTRSVTRGSEGPCSVLMSPAASPCWDAEEPTLQPTQEARQKRLASKRSLRCYQSRRKSTSPPKGSWRGRRSRASRSFSSSSDGDSDSSSSSSSTTSSSRSCSRSLSPPSKCWRRYRSRSSHSSSSSCSSTWSQSRRRSRSSSRSSYLSRSSLRSPSPRRRSTCRKRHDSSSSRDRYEKQKIRSKERAIEERRVVFIGKIPSNMTRSELRHRFSVFGDIEDCTLHFREHGDNYGFVTYRYAEEAFAAIDGGHALCHPDEQPFDLCFGGRRQFCRRNYADLDMNREDFEPAPVKSKLDSLDFDTLLKQAQRRLRR